MTNLIQYALDLGLYVNKNTPSFEMFRDEETGYTVHWSEGLSHSIQAWAKLLPVFRNRLIITTLPWHHHAGLFKKNAQVITRLSDNLAAWDPRDNFLILCNARDEQISAVQEGFKRALLCNQNCLLDWNIYTLNADRTEENRPYKLVINCRPENWKRPHFALGVDGLAVIKGYNFRPNDYFELESLRPDFINSERLAPVEVVDVLNKSRVGGIFSSEEGGCYSSSEYLLCGLPVVSTPSRGGRDVWYDDDNSIIIQEPEEVPAAVETLMRRCVGHSGLRAGIREKHIASSLAMRTHLFDYVDRLAAQEAGVRFSFSEIFNRHYQNKMTRYIKQS